MYNNLQPVLVHICWEAWTWLDIMIFWCTGWQESKCMLGSPKPIIKHKIFTQQVCIQSRRYIIGSSSMPTLGLGSKHSTPLFRGVCFGAWSWKLWWTFKVHLCLFSTQFMWQHIGHYCSNFMKEFVVLFLLLCQCTMLAIYETIFLFWTQYWLANIRYKTF